MKPEKILVLHKTSFYEHYHERSSDVCRGAKAEPFKETHDKHYHCLESVSGVLERAGMSFDVEARGKIRDYCGYTMIITIGGDGTFFEAARYASDQIVLGVNSDPDWSVGRFCATSLNEFGDFFESFLAGEKTPEPLARLTCVFSGGHKPVHFINDILITHQEPAGLSRYRLDIDGVQEEQRSSGLWISTAVGSTGAIHSAGGDVMPHDLSDFQYMPRELYAGWRTEPYKLTGGIIKHDQQVHVCSLMPKGMIYVDGLHNRVEFPVSSTITVKLSDKPLLTLVS